MATIIKIIGSFFIAMAVLFTVFAFATGNGGSLDVILGVSGSAFISGILISAFGSMLTHLEIVSQQSGKQTELLAELLQMAHKSDVPYGRPAADTVSQLDRSHFRFKEI